MNDFFKSESICANWESFKKEEHEKVYPNCLTIIPARGGSKGVHKKNIKAICGKPMISYTINSALESKIDSFVFVSTEDKEIAEVAIEHGAKVPFLRPKYLAQDNSYLEDSYLYSLTKLEKMYEIKYDVVSILLPASPFRTSGLIDDMITFLFEEDLDTVVLVTPDYNRYWEQRPLGWERVVKNEEPYGNRQYKEPIYKEITGTLITRPQVILDYRARVGNKVGFFVVEDPYCCFDIDKEDDFWIAEKMYLRMYNQKYGGFIK